VRKQSKQGQNQCVEEPPPLSSTQRRPQGQAQGGVGVVTIMEFGEANALFLVIQLLLASSACLLSSDDEGDGFGRGPGPVSLTHLPFRKLWTSTTSPFSHMYTHTPFAKTQALFSPPHHHAAHQSINQSPWDAPSATTALGWAPKVLGWLPLSRQS
jgi:hypothetical protein